MKINTFKSFIAFCISILVAYGIYEYFPGEEKSNLHYTSTIIALFYSCITLISAVGVTFESFRITTNVRTVATVFFIIGIFALLLIIYFSESIAVVVIIMGILSLIYVLITYSLSKSKM